MRANIIALLPVVGFFGRLPEFDLGSGASSQEMLPCQKEAPAEIYAEGLDSYKVAVLLFVGAAVLSLL
jgi:hypothetical protein